MSNIALVGLGKMGLSHLAIANANPRLDVVAVCDRSTLLGQMTEKYCGIRYIPEFDDVVAMPGLDAVIVATPSRLHERMIRTALERGLHVFCEKPLTLSAAVSAELAEEAERRGLVAQVGYHNRFVAAFAEAKRLIDAGAIGRVTHVLAEAYGPVVLKPAAATWRSQSSEGGGCLYDYAAHPLNLVNWYFGQPSQCIGSVLPSPMSAEVDDAVYATLLFDRGVTAQLSVNWSDESVRKMTTKLSVWGDKGKLYVDRQEVQLFCGAGAIPPEGYDRGWTVKYTTDLTPPVGYYLRGEEYSAQIEAFADAIAAPGGDVENSFRSAAETDATIEMIRTGSSAPPVRVLSPAERPSRSLAGRLFGRRAG